MILNVALPVPLFRTFDYLPPEETSVDASYIGRRVGVRFGPRFATGIVVGLKEKSDTPPDRLKRIASFLDQEPLFNEKDIEFARWMSEQTMCSIGESIFSLLPPGKGNRQSASDEDAAALSDHAFQSKSTPFEMTPDQAAAIARVHDAVYDDNYRPFLLYGVAAAGKTEVYMAAIRDALTMGKSALVLAPEIGLAIQLAEILRGRFSPESVHVWHGDIPLKERVDLWWRLKKGESCVVVGARSAALVPTPNLGVVVVDEEHDPFYKEERKPRFHARALALKRAEQNRCVALLGSATPSLETWKACLDGKIEKLELPLRAVAASVPRVKIIDLKTEKAFGLLSTSLRSAIEKRLANHEQVILFLNRRGFHRYQLCPQCKWVARCPNCDIALVQHKKNASSSEPSPEAPQPLKKGKKAKRKIDGFLTCHYCGHQQPPAPTCPSCSFDKLISGGFGTQRITDEIAKDFPWAKVARWDADSTKKRGQQEQIYGSMAEGNVDILIGTQVVAHGFNFPRVTLVGVVDADVSLNIPDFRAAERTYQVLAQVAGRAGRDIVTGEVLIQTRHADHYALQAVADFNFQGFAESELKHRDDLNYPPSSRLIQVVAESKKKDKSFEEISKLTDWAEKLELASPIGLLGPSKVRHAKKGTDIGFQLLMKVPDTEFEPFIKQFRSYIEGVGNKFWINVDPEMLR